MFSPFDSPEKMLEKTKRYLISRHPTFTCPVTGEGLDYRRCHIVKFTDPKTGAVKQDLVSRAGFEILDARQPGVFSIVTAEDLLS